MHPAARCAHDPAAVGKPEGTHRRARVDCRSQAQGDMGQPTRQRQRIDMAAGAVPEAAEPGRRAQHAGHRRAVEQFHRRAERRPFPHPFLCELHAPGRVHRLHPPRLLGLRGDAVLVDDGEQIGCAVAQQQVEALAGRTVPLHHGGGIVPGECRDHLAVVAARRTPTGLGRLDDYRADAGLAQMDGGREPGEAGADDDDVGLPVALERPQRRSRRRRGGPQRRRPGDGRGRCGRGRCHAPASNHREQA